MKQPTLLRHAAVTLLAALALGCVLAVQTLLRPAPASAQGAHSLRFYGNVAQDLGRVKIALDSPARPVDVGGDFTLEFWMRALPGENGSGSCAPGGVNWIYGNIMFDRDIFGAGDNGDYGVSLAGGRIAFGVARQTSEQTICGATNVADGAWHHIALVRSSGSGGMGIFVDGRLDGQGNGPTGDISYRDGRTTQYPNSDPFLVLGAEKHSLPGYPGYRGWLDDIRISSSVRYTTEFVRPTQPFSPDGATVALYHLDEGAGATIGDSSGAAGGPSNGERRVGGSPAGPAWSDETPFGTGGAPTTTPGSTQPPAPTSDPDLLLTATALPERNYLPLIDS